MKTIKLMFDYKSLPIWYEDDSKKDFVYSNDFPDGEEIDKHLIDLADKLSNEYDSQYLDNEITFEYVGFKTIEDQNNFIKDSQEFEKIVYDRFGKNYRIVDEIKHYLKYFVNVGDIVKTLVAKGNIPQGTIGKVISITFNSSIKVEINGNKEIVEYENGNVSLI